MNEVLGCLSQLSAPAAEARPGLVAGALRIAAILDSPRLATTHPSACWQTVNKLDGVP